MSFVHQDLGLVDVAERAREPPRRDDRRVALALRHLVARGAAPGARDVRRATACGSIPRAIVGDLQARSSARCSRSCGRSRRSARSDARPRAADPRRADGVPAAGRASTSSSRSSARSRRRRHVDPLRLARPRRGAGDHRPRDRAARRRARRHGRHRARRARAQFVEMIIGRRLAALGEVHHAT